MTQLFLLLAVLVTATISGVFGMAGGLMLMGALMLAMPVAAAMVTHGTVQLVSNGWRAVLHRCSDLCPHERCELPALHTVDRHRSWRDLPHASGVFVHAMSSASRP